MGVAGGGLHLGVAWALAAAEGSVAHERSEARATLLPRGASEEPDDDFQVGRQKKKPSKSLI